MTLFPDQETVIREVGKAYDQIKQLRALLQFKPRKSGDDHVLSMHELAQPLFEEALQGLNHSLHIMKSGIHKKMPEVKQEVKGSDHSGVPGDDSSVLFDGFGRKIANKRGKRRRTEDDSWTCTTTMPYDDGYQWRKYGEKKMTGTNTSRSYFRCTFKEEQGCQAKKLVQETSTNSSTSSAAFQVTYTNKHTCNNNNNNNSHMPIFPISPLQMQAFQLPDVYDHHDEEMHHHRRRNISCMNIHDINYMPCYNSGDHEGSPGEEDDRSRLSCWAVPRPGEYWEDVEALVMELVGFDSDPSMPISS